MPKRKLSVEDVREARADIRREIVNAVALMVAVMDQKELPDGTNFGREAKNIASQMAKIGMQPQEILEVFQEGIEQSQVKAKGLLDLIKVLQVVFASAVTPTVAARKKPAARRGRSFLTVIV